MQFPVNWMGVPWVFKKCIDEVHTAGMDGRTAEATKANCGTGGLLNGTKYMLSVTFNAPREAFDDPAEPFFAGASVDDLLWPMHLNANGKIPVIEDRAEGRAIFESGAILRHFAQK